MGYWPQGIPREESLAAFRSVFQALGYRECTGSGLENGYEKIAIFAKSEDGVLEPTHAARQLPNGRWTSKLGRMEDIEHDEVDDVNCPTYGTPFLFMRRATPEDS